MSVDLLYNQLWTEHGTDLKSLGWSSMGAQLRRFSILQECLTTPGSLLDVGCGFGDFSMYSNSEDYTGIDIIPGFIEEAQRKYPTKTFICKDFLKYEPLHQFDYVIGNGVLAYQENPINVIQHMWDFTDKVLAFTWLNATRNEINLVLGMCGCEYYTIRHDFLPNDTVIFMYRQPNAS